MEIAKTEIQILDFSKYQFRASSTGNLMSESQGKSNMELYLDAKEKLNSTRIKGLEAIQKATEKRDSIKNQETKTYKEAEERVNKLTLKLVDDTKKLQDEIALLELCKDEVTLSVTCISELLKIYIFEKYGRRYDIESKYIDKGNQVEEAAITILSEIDGDFYVKNKVRKYNDWIQGECDLEKEDEIEDMKSSWSLETFQKRTIEPIDKKYWWQGQCYMWLWNKENYRLSYVLIDTPKGLIEDECKRMLYKMGSNHDETGVYLQACEEIKFNSTFPDLSLRERVFRKRFKFNPDAIEALKERIEECRKWLNNYAKKEYDRNSNIEELEFEEVSFFKPKKELPVLESVSVENGSLDLPLPEENLVLKTEIAVVENSLVKEIAITINPEIQEKIAEVLISSVNDAQIIKDEPILTEVGKELEELNKESEGIDKINKILKEIEECDSQEKVREKYNQYKTEYNTIEEIKNALIKKRDSFETPKPQEPVKPVAQKSVPVAAKPTPTQEVKIDDEALKNQIREKVSSCKTGIEIKTYCNSNPEIMKLIRSDKELAGFINKIGIALENNLTPDISSL